MKHMFEAVVFSGSKLFWDYRLHNTDNYKGHYHWHQCCEVLYVHEGEGRVVVNGDTFQIRKGMLFFLQPYQLHYVYANVSQEQPYTRTICHFDLMLIDELLRPFAKRYELYTVLWRGQNSVQAFDLMAYSGRIECDFSDYDLARTEGKGEDTEEIAMLILRILDTIIRSTPAEQKRTSNTKERRCAGYAQEAMQWIDEYYQKSFRLEDLANDLHLSKFYLSKLFHEETGSTLKEYITAKRLRQACRLLETTSKSIEWIAGGVGIPNASYFAKVFKQEVGITPLKYRTEFIHSNKK
ncbi:AraC family transcriptional regulator [Paenibacillus sp. S150]|uniref:AraC family transcriptional regulator n=1 Tax=Paenibacillus sp. S150 TaxID=2749826 RepID=UPI001C55E450|nr:AraC family transcriptional regulator [Paenibacillus sp. S150]MBW4080009.1 helix-turn-helix transcriptional regulator [Paenibacillus sp. S150]